MKLLCTKGQKVETRRDIILSLILQKVGVTSPSCTPARVANTEPVSAVCSAHDAST